jgi:hypothetical protein
VSIFSGEDHEVDEMTIGGSGDDIIYDMMMTSDGNVVLAGATTSYGAGGSDVYFLKISPGGPVLWERVIGGVNDDEARGIAEAADGGLVIIGYTKSYGIQDIGPYTVESNPFVYIIKTDANGEL